jgi:hypothetical protein
MKRKSNLSEELYIMRKLMGYDSKKDIENITSYDRLIEETLVKKTLLKEQGTNVDIDAGTVANQGGKGTMRGNVGIGFTGKEKDKKATQEDIANLGEDVFSTEILNVIKGGKSLKITEEQAKEISKAFVDKAQVKGSETNKKFKQGLLNGTLNFKRLLPEGVKLDVLGTKVNARWSVNGATIKGGDGTETPEIPVYDSNMDIIYKSTNPLEISKWVTNQNIDLFKSGEQQYYLTTFREKGNPPKPQPSQSGFFMAVKGETIADGIVVVGVGSSESTEGTTTPGTITEEKIPVDLVVEMGESFKTGFDTFKDTNSAKTILLNKIKDELNKKGYINLDITDISVVSSASNYYGGVVEFTHDKSGNPVKSDINFNQKPTKTNDTNVDKNNLLAWNRGLRILNLLKQTNDTDLGDNLGKITIPDDVNEKVEWRVTDTGGKVDPAGAEGGGQYAKLFIKGVAMRTDVGETLPTTTPGSNEANLRQGIIYLNAESLKGGIRMATWFSLYQGKYDKTGKAKPRMTGTFSGLPKWLDNIVYK